jgi:prophage regulatory protein
MNNPEQAKEELIKDVEPLREEQRSVTVRHVARRFGVSPSSIWRWVKRGKFPEPVRLGENCTRWRMSDLHEWENRQGGEVEP